MKSPNDPKWLNDYDEFLTADHSVVSTEMQKKVSSHMRNLLNPSALVVFAKILGIHIGVGFLSLSVCHQFGINPFETEFSLDSWMMHLGGYQFCMIGCGILFVSASLFAAGYFLTIEEINALKRTEILQALALGLISLGLFAIVGAELALGLAALWLVGGLIGGYAATEFMWRLKQV